MSIRRALLGAAMLLGLTVGQANAATLLGSNASMIYYYPDSGTAYCNNGSQTIGGGTEFPDYCGSPLTTVDISGNQIIVDSTFAYNNTSFNGFVLSFTGAPTITGLAYNVASSLGITSYFFTGDTMTFNFAGQTTGRAVFDVSLASPVPIPAALPLLASGLGALGFIGWRRKRRSNVTV